MPKLNADLVYAFDSRPNVILPAVYIKLLRGIPLLIDWTDWFGRGGTISERAGKIYRFLFELIETYFEEHFRKYADGSTVICSTLEKRLRSLGYKNRILNFPLGCYANSQKKWNIGGYRIRMGLDPDLFMIGCVGTLLPSDADFLFQSFNLLSRQINAQLLLIGENIFKNRYHKPENVIETGRVSRSNLINFIHCCDIMVMPMKNNIANNGRWPSKLNDYLAAGKPIVSTSICVVEELMKFEKFGELAKDEPKDFSQKIIRLLRNRKHQEEYGRNANKLASSYLNWNVIMNQLNTFIMDFLN